jgi:NAD(P)-dependent dehydrogenase (short-subunit alcohol dehydrogenase family)
MSSVAGVMTFPVFGPYAMTKFALEAMGKTFRAELAPLGVDVTMINPGPFQTGFNDRMADSMWEWFDARASSDSATEILRGVTDLVKQDQLDPADVARKLVELVEAETTEENNFVPAEVREQFDLA